MDKYQNLALTALQTLINACGGEFEDEDLALYILSGTIKNACIEEKADPSEKSNYYIVYKPDRSENYTRTATSESEVLDEIMLSEDGDLANYEIFEQII